MRADGPSPPVVVAATRSAEAVLSLDLASPAGGLLPAWTPGAHTFFSLPGLEQKRNQRATAGVLIGEEARSAIRRALSAQ